MLGRMYRRGKQLTSLAQAVIGLALLLGALEVPLAELAIGENSLTHELSRLEDGGAAPIVEQASHPRQSPHFDSSHVRFHHCGDFCNAQSRHHVQLGHETQLVTQVRVLRWVSHEAWHTARPIGLGSRSPRAPPSV